MRKWLSLNVTQPFVLVASLKKDTEHAEVGVAQTVYFVVTKYILKTSRHVYVSKHFFSLLLQIDFPNGACCMWNVHFLENKC